VAGDVSHPGAATRNQVRQTLHEKVFTQPHLFTNPRYKQENMLILGAWWGRKPTFSCFLGPLSEQLNSLKDLGFFAQNHLEENIHVTLRMLTATADNPAKEALDNYKANTCRLCHQVRTWKKKKKKKKSFKNCLFSQNLNKSLSSEREQCHKCRKRAHVSCSRPSGSQEDHGQHAGRCWPRH